MLKIGIVTTMQMVRKATLCASTVFSRPLIAWATFTFSWSSRTYMKGMNRRIFSTRVRRPARAPSLAARAARTRMTLSSALLSRTCSGLVASAPSRYEISNSIEAVPMRSIQKKKPPGYPLSESVSPTNS
ncbi:unnamed protein product [Prorocentrum cordatum]|uniref:Secreted protein n=1 Tax=Prorocentrum cordatum TaxID=2364126 RepID=A0ABN9VNG2_9DINO|nr:unnamed protein product [Polarella glacialis]